MKSLMIIFLVFTFLCVNGQPGPMGRYPYDHIAMMGDSNISVEDNRDSKNQIIYRRSRYISTFSKRIYYFVLNDTAFEAYSRPKRLNGNFSFIVHQKDCSCKITLENIFEQEYFINLTEINWCSFDGKNILLKLEDPKMSFVSGKFEPTYHRVYNEVYNIAWLYYIEKNLKHWKNPNVSFIDIPHSDSKNKGTNYFIVLENIFECDLTSLLLKELGLRKEIVSPKDTVGYNFILLEK